MGSNWKKRIAQGVGIYLLLELLAGVVLAWMLAH